MYSFISIPIYSASPKARQMAITCKDKIPMAIQPRNYLLIMLAKEIVTRLSVVLSIK